MVYLLLLLFCRALVGCPDASKVKYLGDVLDSVSLLPFATFKVTTFGRFTNLAQILIYHSIFFAQ